MKERDTACDRKNEYVPVGPDVTLSLPLTLTLYQVSAHAAIFCSYMRWLHLGPAD
jgi:hypothetical protein